MYMDDRKTMRFEGSLLMWYAMDEDRKRRRRGADATTGAGRSVRAMRPRRAYSG